LIIIISNQLTALPPELGQLQRLRKLWADRNQLASVPDELGNCGELQVHQHYPTLV
jgi:Leucine-rich repeat (LRR) protein